MNIKILSESAKIVRRHFRGCRPVCGLILGSGWKTVVDVFAVKKLLSYSDLPVLGKTTVAGHSGFIFRAELCGLETLIFQGRHHWYEGLGWEPVALPVYILKDLGAAAVILTNSAGGIRPDLRGGCFMAIADHINGMAVNPLQGSHDDFWGKRFPDQGKVYDPELRRLLKMSARKAKVPLAEGVYYAAPGPVYETPAEIRALRRIGVDAVGMSTVPESILASAAGLRVLGLSLISNRAAGLEKKALDHAEVIKTGRASAGQMRVLMKSFWKALAAEKNHE